MGRIKNFKPSRDQLAGLRDDITFTLTGLGELQPVEYRIQTDIDAQRAVANQDTLFINSGPSELINSILPGDSNLQEATQTQILEEIQRVGAIRAQVRAKESHLVSIKYKAEGIDEFQQIPKVGFASELNNAEVQVQRSTKGEILDIASQFTALRDDAFTNFVIASQSSFTEVIQIDGTDFADSHTVKVEDASFFNPGDFITFIIPANFQDVGQKDVLLHKVIKVQDNSIEIGYIGESKDDPLFSEQERSLEKRILALPGIPILWRDKKYNSSLSLLETQTLIEGRVGNTNEDSIIGEIPFTRLFDVKAEDENTAENRIGNLNKDSFNVVLYEDNRQVFLVKEGEALPGVTVAYDLITQNKNDADVTRGDINVTIQLVAPVAKLRTTGFTEAGANAIRISNSTPISSTPDPRIIGESQSDYAGVEVGGLSPQEAAEAARIPGSGEFYFNYQLVQTKLVDKTNEVSAFLTLDTSLDLTNYVEISIKAVGSTYKQEVSFSSIPDVGEFKLSYKGVATTALPFNASASDISRALRAIPGIPKFTTIGNVRNGFTIQFTDDPILVGVVVLEEPPPPALLASESDLIAVGPIIHAINATQDLAVQLPASDLNPQGTSRKIINTSTNGSKITVEPISQIGDIELEVGGQDEVSLQLVGQHWEQTTEPVGFTSEIVNTINLNRYGTIRILDKIEISPEDSSNSKFGAVVKNIDPNRNLIILSNSLGRSIPSGSVIEVPQSPLSPGKTYRLQITGTHED